MKNSAHHYVITTVSYCEDNCEEPIIDAGLHLIEVIKDKPGIINIDFFHSKSIKKTIMIWHCVSEEAHLNCIQSVEFNAAIQANADIWKLKHVNFSNIELEKLQ